MTPLPRVCVLLASYNGRAWIAEQIDTILSQSGVAVSVLVSDDGSTDGTTEWIAELGARESRVQLLPALAPSGSSARNFARLLCDVDLGNVDFVGFSDQDDLWLPGKLVRAIDTLRATGADAYSSNTTAWFADGSRRLIRKDQPQRRYDHYFESAGPGSSFVLSRRLAEALQRQVRTMSNAPQGSSARLFAFHDWFVYCFARCAGFRWTIDNQALVVYRQHGGNEVGANIGLGALRSRMRKLRAGWYLEEVAWLCDVMAPVARQAGQSALAVDQVRSGGLVGRIQFVLDVGRQARRRLRDRWGFNACVLLGLVR